jgi:hypothetical protein
MKIETKEAKMQTRDSGKEIAELKKQVKKINIQIDLLINASKSIEKLISILLETKADKV